MAISSTKPWCLLFTGSNKSQAPVDEIGQVIQMVRESRKHTGNTGLTVFSGGNTLIYIEGDKSSIEAEYEAAKRHPLQQSTIKIYEAELHQRFFEDYALAVKIASPDSLKQFDDFSSPEKAEYFDEFLEVDHGVSKIVKDFIRNNG